VGEGVWVILGVVSDDIAFSGRLSAISKVERDRESANEARYGKPGPKLGRASSCATDLRLPGRS
jgi:hypothetical protein